MYTIETGQFWFKFSPTQGVVLVFRTGLLEDLGEKSNPALLPFLSACPVGRAFVFWLLTAPELAPELLFRTLPISIPRRGPFLGPWINHPLNLKVAS
jgi:hypothetical protein